MKRLWLAAAVALLLSLVMLEAATSAAAASAAASTSHAKTRRQLNQTLLNATCPDLVRPNATDGDGSGDGSGSNNSTDGDEESDVDEDDCVHIARLRALEDEENRKTPEEQVAEEKRANMKDPAMRQLEKELDARNKSEQIGDDDECLPVPCAAPPCPKECKKKHFSTCHPICSWRCDDPECPLECNPVCDPINCYTHCRELECPVCKPHCKKPLCAIRCPADWCPKEGCPKCDVVCAPYQCHTECEPPPPECEPLCDPVRCFNNCTRPATCKKPKCHLECERPACEEPQCCPCTDLNNLAAAVQIAQHGVSPFLTAPPARYPRFRARAAGAMQSASAVPSEALQPVLEAAGLPPIPPNMQLQVFDAADLAANVVAQPAASAAASPLDSESSSAPEPLSLLELMNEMTTREKQGQLHMCCPCASRN